MTLINELDLDWVNENHRAEYLGQRPHTERSIAQLWSLKKNTETEPKTR